MDKMKDHLKIAIGCEIYIYYISNIWFSCSINYTVYNNARLRYLHLWTCIVRLAYVIESYQSILYLSHSDSSKTTVCPNAVLMMAHRCWPTIGPTLVQHLVIAGISIFTWHSHILTLSSPELTFVSPLSHLCPTSSLTLSVRGPSLYVRIWRPSLYVRIWRIKTSDSDVWRQSRTERIKILIVAVDSLHRYWNDDSKLKKPFGLHGLWWNMSGL